MKQVFRAHRLCKQDGPLGPYIDSYEAEMRGEGYARQTREVQIRLVADLGEAPGVFRYRRFGPVSGGVRSRPERPRRYPLSESHCT